MKFRYKIIDTDDKKVLGIVDVFEKAKWMIEELNCNRKNGKYIMIREIVWR